MAEPHSSNFRVITTNFLSVRKLRIITVNSYGNTLTIEYDLRYLPTLYSRSIGAFWWALKLKCHFPTVHFCHSFLSEVAQLWAVKDGTGSVKRIWFHLNWIVKHDGERVTGTVREEPCVCLSQDETVLLQFNFHLVFGSTIARAVQSETGNKDSPIHSKLNAVTASPVPPLIASVCWWLKTVAFLRKQAWPSLTFERQLWFVSGSEIQENIGGFMWSEQSGLSRSVRKFFQEHSRYSDQIERITQNFSLVLRCRINVSTLAFSLSPSISSIENGHFSGIESFSEENTF